MNEIIKVPKWNGDDSIAPCWIETVNTKGEKRRPHVKCLCGQTMAIGNHHVHKDGMVTASFFHSEQMPGGCGWHVFIQLVDYNGDEWKPGVDQNERLKDFD